MDRSCHLTGIAAEFCDLPGGKGLFFETSTDLQRSLSCHGPVVGKAPEPVFIHGAVAERTALQVIEKLPPVGEDHLQGVGSESAEELGIGIRPRGLDPSFKNTALAKGSVPLIS